MSKAQTINRLELTRKKFSGIQNEAANEVQHEAPKDEHEEHYGLSTCPNCEQLTLIHEGGCSRCPSCGWSACG